jgi:hypothetical protein
MTREQAMWEAAKRGLGAWGAFLGEDHADPEQAAAGADAERARVVAWFRSVGMSEAADAIERGEHWKE